MSRRPFPTRIIGWREWLALPDFQIDRIKVKVDTGARTSALHAYDMESFQRDGAAWIRFTLHPKQGDNVTVQRVEALLKERRKVRPSTGEAKLRPVIEVPVQIGPDRWQIEITLVRRDMMGFRMLLGREAVRGRYLVDPGRSFLAGRPRLDF
jgi:hypothetical protein